jgi:hypothetical protein
MIVFSTDSSWRILRSTSAEIRAPGSVVGTHYWQVVTNTRGEVFEGRNRENNTGLSLAPVAVDLPELVVGGPALSRQFDAVGEAHWFKFIPSAGQDVIVRLDRAGTGATELYIGQGYMPTRERFDARQNELNAPDVSTLAASTAAQTYYALAYPASLPSGAAASFTISARALDFSLDAVGPQQVGNAGTVTLALHGGQLRSDMTFEIVDSHGGVHSAESVFISDSSLAYVTFDLTGLPLGTYSVRVRDGDVAGPPLITVAARNGRPQRDGVGAAPPYLAYHADAADLPRARHLAVVLLVRRQRRQLEKWRAGIEQHLDAVADGNLAVALDAGDFITLKGALRFTESNADLTVSLIERESGEATDTVATMLVATTTTSSLPPGWSTTPGIRYPSSCLLTGGVR